MRSNVIWSKASAAISGLMLAGALLGWCQVREGGQFSRQGVEEPDVNPVFDAKRLKALNADRQKTMVSDTEKLVKLARQLDAEIASNSTGELTPEEVRKLETIEKLAHTVKAKMAESFGGGPEIKPLFSPSRSRPDQ